MNPLVLDYYFPFFVFFYGFIMTLLLNSKWSLKLIHERLPVDFAERFQSHKYLGFICFLVGFVWSLQNLWLGSPPIGR
jgi:hypothetical protein